MVFNLDDKVYSIGMSKVISGHGVGGHSLLAVGSGDQKVRLCDIRSGNTAHSLIGHKEAILVVKWFPQSEYLLATASQDKSIRFWDIRKAG